MKYYFIHIPKTAGMTIEKVFWDYLKVNVGHSFFRNKQNFKRNLKEKYKFLKISNHHIPINFLNKEFTKKLFEYNSLVIVRNPYDRIVSVFKFWIKFIDQHKNTKDKHYKKLIKKVNILYDSFEISKQNLNNFIKKVLSDNKNKYSLDGHLLPMYLYVYVNIDGVLKKVPQYILKFENLNNEFNKFKNENNLNIPDDILNEISINKAYNTDISRKDLDDESIRLINNYYKLDFKYFNYDIHLPKHVPRIV